MGRKETNQTKQKHKKKSHTSRPPDKSEYWKTIFFVSHPKHMLWVLKHLFKLMGKKKNDNFTHIKFPYLNLYIQESQEVRPFPACDHKAAMNRHDSMRYTKHK